jgi:hypothetical protein
VAIAVTMMSEISRMRNNLWDWQEGHMQNQGLLRDLRDECSKLHRQIEQGKSAGREAIGIRN